MASLCDADAARITTIVRERALDAECRVRGSHANARVNETLLRLLRDSALLAVLTSRVLVVRVEWRSEVVPCCPG